MRKEKADHVILVFGFRIVDRNGNSKILQVWQFYRAFLDYQFYRVLFQPFGTLRLDGAEPHAADHTLFREHQGHPRSADMTFDDLVRFKDFVTDRPYFPVYSVVRARYVTNPKFASTLVIDSGFTFPQFKVEVEVTAMK